MLAIETCPVCGNPPQLFGHESCEMVDSTPLMQLTVLDLFAGTGSSTQAFEDRGHHVVKVELDPSHNPDLVADVTQLDPKMLLREYGQFDFVWASPPCTAFSVASIGHHWAGDAHFKRPKTQFAVEAQLVVQSTFSLIDALSPTVGYLVENPRGILRKLDVVMGRNRSTVTYCQYGETRMKPTDLWGGIGPDGWMPSRSCRNGDPCHESAPRGARTGTQGIVGAKDRSRVPYRLSTEVALKVESAMSDVMRMAA